MVLLEQLSDCLVGLLARFSAASLVERSSTAVKKLASEMDKRFMGPREEARVGAICALGAVEIVQRMATGEELRTDDFFELSGSRIDNSAS